MTTMTCDGIPGWDQVKAGIKHEGTIKDLDTLVDTLVNAMMSAGHVTFLPITQVPVTKVRVLLESEEGTWKRVLTIVFDSGLGWVVDTIKRPVTPNPRYWR